MRTVLLALALNPTASPALLTIQPRATDRVVTTLGFGQSDSTSPVRFVAVLLPNQKVTISVPGGLNGQSATIDIIRRGDDVTIARQGVPTN